MRRSTGGIVGIHSGFQQLDEMLSGFHNAEFIIIGDPPLYRERTAFSNKYDWIILQLRIEFLAVFLP